VPVAIDDWYARREYTAEGEFFRHIADQGPKPSADFHTRQGLYVVSPGGRLLAYKNSGEFPDLTRQLLTDGLKGWADLEEDATSGSVGGVLDDPRYPRTPPAGTLVLGVRHRRLRRAAEGYDVGVPDKPGGQLVMRQTIWFTPDEVKGLLPSPRVGATANVPSTVRARLARFYAQDVTQGDGEYWPRASLRQLTMTASTTGVTETEQHVRYDGRLELEHPTHGRCLARLRGEASWDHRSGVFVRFEWVLVNDHTRPDGSERVTAALFGLPDPTDAADRFPPDGLKTPEAYWRNGGE
jgi:hypothetical protein